MTASCLSYSIDTENRFNYISGDWNRFAAENGTPSLTADGVIGKSIFGYICDDNTRAIYRTLFERVRHGNGPIRFAFRCDAPAKRRFMDMAISRQPDDTIHFCSCVVREESREPVLLLDPRVPRSGDLLKICGWCKKVMLESSEWLEIEDAVARLGLFGAPVLPGLTHGMCASCHAAFRRELDNSVKPPGQT